MRKKRKTIIYFKTTATLSPPQPNQARQLKFPLFLKKSPLVYRGNYGILGYFGKNQNFLSIFNPPATSLTKKDACLFCLVGERQIK